MPKKLVENNSHNKYCTFYDITLLPDSKFDCFPKSLTNFF